MPEVQRNRKRIESVSHANRSRSRELTQTPGKTYRKALLKGQLPDN